MAIDTTHQMLITHTGKSVVLCAFLGLCDVFSQVYTYTITNWGNPAILELIVW